MAAGASVADAYKLLFSVVFSLGLCAGCATWRGAPVPVEEGFDLRGKVAVRDEKDNFTARIVWQQRGDSFEIDLWGPLGQGRVQLVRREGTVSLVDGSGAVLASGPPETVMLRHLGWSLPLDVMPAWVQGGPLDGVPADQLEYHDSGAVRSFRQLDWQVTLPEYQPVAGAVDGRFRPRLVIAERGATRLRLVISEWRI